MPIEDSSEDTMNEKSDVKNKEIFVQDTMVIAGFEVKHKLYECKLLLIGFTDYCPSDQENTKVEGLNFIPSYSTSSRKIYPKLFIDFKQKESIDLLGLKWDKKFNYYYYESISDKWASHGCNII